MAKSIAGNAISQKWLKFDTDWIDQTQALPNATDETSAVFQAGFDANGIAIIVQADTTVNIADGESLLYELLYDTSETGAFASKLTLYDQTADGSDITFEIGEDLFPEYNPGEIGPYCMIKRTTSADESADLVNEYLRYVTR